MARERDPNRDKAYEIWKQHDGNITNREIAHLLSTDEKKIAVWKQRDKWNVVQQSKSKDKNVVQQKKNKKNKSGNPNPVKKFTKRNQAAVTHGLFAKYLPKETLEIVYQIDQASPIEIIWMNIQLQFAQIVRAQQIMFVESKDDITIETKKERSSINGDETEYEIQFAWDKQASFLNSQSRAMTTLQKLIEQYESMASEEQLLKVEKLKADIARIKGDPEEEYEDDGFIDALESKMDEVWDDEEN